MDLAQESMTNFHSVKEQEIYGQHVQEKKENILDKYNESDSSLKINLMSDEKASYVKVEQTK